MANHTSAKKRIRRNDRRAAINGARISRIRTLVKKVEAALAAGDLAAAEEHGRALVAFSEQAYSMCPNHPHLALQVLV